MNVTCKMQGRELLIKLSGELDHHAAKETIHEMDRRIDENLPRTCVLDLSEVSFMDSSGIAVVLRAQRRISALDGALMVQSVPAQAMKVLSAAGINRMVKIV